MEKAPSTGHMQEQQHAGQTRGSGGLMHEVKHMTCFWLDPCIIAQNIFWITLTTYSVKNVSEISENYL